MQLQAFPVYPLKSQQFRFTSPTTDVAGYALYAPDNAFLPFRVIKPADGRIFACVTVFDLLDQEITTIGKSGMNWKMFSDGNYDYVYYFGTPISGLNLPCGKYYLQIGSYYSEVFTVGSDINSLLKLTWRSGKPVGNLTYVPGWYQTAYLNNGIDQPEYPVDVAFQTNGLNQDIIQTGKVAKVYRIVTEPLPEFLTDALSLLPLHSEISVGSITGVQKVELRPSYLAHGLNLSSLEIKFTEEEIFTGGCNNDLFTEINADGAGNLPGSCGIQADTSAYWVDTPNYTCEKTNGQNTGYANQEQKDQNPDSPTYGQTRTVRIASNLCPVVVAVYKNTEIIDFITRNNCEYGYEGEQVLYTVPAGQFTSTVSQQEAQSQAQAYFDANKQAYANENGSCFISEWEPVYSKSGCFDNIMQKGNQRRAATSTEIKQYAREFDDDGNPCQNLNGL